MGNQTSSEGKNLFSLSLCLQMFWMASSYSYYWLIHILQLWNYNLIRLKHNIKSRSISYRKLFCTLNQLLESHLLATVG